MSPLQAALELQAEQARLARIILQEALRIERARRHPVNRAGRALAGLWRSIASGGWE